MARVKRLKRTVRRYIAGGRLHTTYVRLKSLNLVRPTMPAEAARRLKAVFEPEIYSLQSAIGQDLSRWLR